MPQYLRISLVKCSVLWPVTCLDVYSNFSPGNWVIVTHTEGMQCRTMLDNILCGIMYRFRVRAFNEVGSSIPGIASDAFVIDTPGVHIAPYFILCPPAETTRYIHQTAQFRAKALGTPKPNILKIRLFSIGNTFYNSEKLFNTLTNKVIRLDI